MTPFPEMTLPITPPSAAAPWSARWFIREKMR